jgi:pimeloyl-ACP methyl ester carboxylesterase
MRWKLGLAAAALIVAGLAYWGLRVYTPPIEGAAPIASLEPVALGGAKQWVLIRGRNRHAPIVLFLHGGPGMPMMYLAYAFQRPLEKDFLVVQWDRLGAGKSYEAGANDVAKMRISREIADTVELIEKLRARFGARKVILVGHSYGSTIGVRVAAARPDLVRAYVGVGQVACSRPEELKLQDAWLADQAKRRGDAGVLAAATAHKPYDRQSALFRYGGELAGATGFMRLVMIGLGAPEYSLMDVFNVKRGVDFTHAHLIDDVSHGALMDDVTALGVPVYFFEGRRDYTAPFSCAVRYFNRLKAPEKHLVWFGHAAHFPFLSEPQAFATALRRVAAETRATGN